MEALVEKAPGVRGILDTLTIKRKNLWKEMKKNRQCYVLAAPYTIFFITFTLLPVIISFVLGFTYFNMLQPPQWRGWMNYTRLFLDDDIFLIAVKNTMLFVFVTGPISFVLCFIFAWLVNEMTPRPRALFTLLFYGPVLTGNTFVVWKFIFSGDQYGIINGFLMKLGLLKEPVNWLIDTRYNLKILIMVQLWLALGTGFLVFIAAFQSIDKNLYEAAAIDGVMNRFQEVWYITVPSIVPQLLFAIVTQTVVSFAVCEVSIELAGFPSTEYSAETVVTHLIDYGNIRFEMGYASAITTLLFLAMVLTNKFILSLLKKIT